MPKIIQVITAVIVFLVMFCQILGLNILNEFEMVIFSLFKLFYFVCMGVLPTCTSMHLAPAEAREGIRSAVIIVTDGCEQPPGTGYGTWELWKSS